MAKNSGWVMVPGDWGSVYANKEEAWDALMAEMERMVDKYNAGNKSDVIKFFQYWFDWDFVQQKHKSSYTVED